MKEREHLINVLRQAQSAIKNNNTAQLHSLSDQTIHSASIYQHTDEIVLAVIIYALSKIINREKNFGVDRDKLINKLLPLFTLIIKALEDNDQESYIAGLERIRKALTNFSVNMKPYVQEVLVKASINKATKIYEHGISLGKTANLLGVTQWEMADYIGQKNIPEVKYNRTLDVKSRVRMAMEFFR